VSQRGLFVSFEGGEGSGKTTQVERLQTALTAQGRETVCLREPGGTPLGEEIRRRLLQRREPIMPESELLLFLAARSELVRAVIQPALEAGKVVLCDRFSDSTLAYQGFARGLDLDEIRRLDRFATAGLTPDLTVLLDLPVKSGRSRKDRDEDAFQREDDAFHERVRQGYLSLAAAEPDRWLVLDAIQPPAELAEAIVERVQSLLR
jgi:dTMP kinase